MMIASAAFDNCYILSEHQKLTGYSRDVVSNTVYTRVKNRSTYKPTLCFHIKIQSKLVTHIILAENVNC